MLDQDEVTLIASPPSVALVGLGVSRLSFTSHTMKAGYQRDSQLWDEVWTLNNGFMVYHHDKVFAMDDLQVKARRWPYIGKLLAAHTKPIITSQAYPEFPMSRTYPLKMVTHSLGLDFFPNSAVYAIAYALATGVKDLYIYGLDFSYPDAWANEMGGQGAALYLGMAGQFGMRYHLPDTTNFLNANKIKVVNGRPYRSLYGYLKHPLIKDEQMAWEIQAEEGVRQADENINTTTNLADIKPTVLASLEGEQDA